ncbi:hypothetical protein NPIL_494601 [Nephila pilipes]|uniref:Uncharacterized protein n=1 Tax=Nephila pilipes TaxID=299642 RepID=A0A8X6NSH7_NEPPI|nr:hypothetical protein NPIL_494601 [Nephila pilipes]
MSRRTIDKINLSEKGIFQLYQEISESDSDSDGKSDFTDEDYIPEDGNASTSGDECSLITRSAQNYYSCESENEVSIIITDSQLASTSRGRNQ